MKYNRAIQKLSSKKTYTRAELIQAFGSEMGALSESSFRWILYQCLQEKLLFKSGYNTYSKTAPETLLEYHPVYSEKCLKIKKFLCERFPDLEFVLFESVLLNEFLNHQIAQNTLYLQIEKDVSKFVFNELQSCLPGQILYNPQKKELDNYWSKNCVIVLNLISQSPVSSSDVHEITLEKMLVDIISERAIRTVYSPSELPCIFEHAKEHFYLDARRLQRYAGRRGKTEEIQKYMK